MDSFLNINKFLKKIILDIWQKLGTEGKGEKIDDWGDENTKSLLGWRVARQHMSGSGQLKLFVRHKRVRMETFSVKGTRGTIRAGARCQGRHKVWLNQESL